MENEAMNKTQAIELINGIIKAEDKWKAFDKFLDEQVNKDSRFLKKSVIKGLILEALGCKVDDYLKRTINKAMRGLTEERQQYVNKRFLSIKSLISQAHNNAPKSKGAEKKKRSRLIVNLPGSPDTDTDLTTFDGLKALLIYRLDELPLKEILEIEGIVRVKSKAVKDTERVTVARA